MFAGLGLPRLMKVYNIGRFGPDPILLTLAHNKRNIDEYYFLVELKL